MERLHRDGLGSLARSIHANAHAKGFYVQDAAISEILSNLHREDLTEAHEQNLIVKRLKLIDSETSEALEDLRQNGTLATKDLVLEELADVVIRALDLAEYIAPGEIGDAVYDKHTRNMSRPHMHGKEF